MVICFFPKEEYKMLKKFRYLISYIMLIGGSHLAYLFYGDKKYIVYFIFSIFLIIKALVEFLRFYGNKGVDSYLNKLLKKRSVISSIILILSFGVFIILSFKFYINFVQAPLMIEGWRALLKKFTDIIDLLASLIFFLMILFDYIILSSKKYQIEEGIESLNKGGKILIRELKTFKKEYKGYIIYKDILVGEKGIFNMLPLYYPGDNIKIKISEEGVWTKEKSRKIIDMENKEEIINLKREKLKEIFSEEYEIFDIIVIINERNLIEGSNFVKVKFVKISNLLNTIKGINSEKKLSKEDLHSIKKKLKEVY